MEGFPHPYRKWYVGILKRLATFMIQNKILMVVNNENAPLKQV
jgi:hypothetical protein